MVSLNDGERRHRIGPSELPWVRLAIENELKNLIKNGVLTYQIEHLFRLWWRIRTHRRGRPNYPDPLTLKVIKKYLTGEEMVPNREAEQLNMEEVA